jgi:D-alanyl-D-alanine-carboxypeptidase/D-alanyl-D-alanine-endopeptidase
MVFRGLIAIACILSCSVALADPAGDIEKLAAPLIESKSMVGCVVGVLENGQTKIYSFGEVNRGKGDKPNGDTLYEIGSLTKAFTGTLLGDMVNRGVVALDTPLQDLLPENVKLQAADDKPIKLVDLASQSSGLPRLPTNLKPKDWKNPYADYTPELLYEFLNGYKPDRAPGKYEYSNLGMGLLGHVLARKAGKSYEQLVVERICDPLAMNDTRTTLSDEQRKRLAPPYSVSLEPDANWDLDALAGCGALRSSANDLLKFAKAALADNDLDVSKAIHEAWKPHYQKKGDFTTGLAWIQAHDGVTWWHNGQTGGYTSALFIFPPKKLAVVVLANTSTELTTTLAEKILVSLAGGKPDPIAVRKTVKVDPAVLKSYEGKYALAPVFAITVTIEDGKLMAQATGQPKFEVFPESETEFFYKVVDAKLSFEKDKDGKVSGLVLHQNGLNLPGTKAAEESPAKATAEK